jgi:hypothetical protein
LDPLFPAPPPPLPLPLPLPPLLCKRTCACARDRDCDRGLDLERGLDRERARWRPPVPPCRPRGCSSGSRAPSVLQECAARTLPLPPLSPPSPRSTDSSHRSSNTCAGFSCCCFIASCSFCRRSRLRSMSSLCLRRACCCCFRPFFPSGNAPPMCSPSSLAPPPSTSTSYCFACVANVTPSPLSSSSTNSCGASIPAPRMYTAEENATSSAAISPNMVDPPQIGCEFSSTVIAAVDNSACCSAA